MQRAQALERRLPVRPDTLLYVDAAGYHQPDVYALAIVNCRTTPPDMFPVHGLCPATAKEAAIALTLSQKPTPPIVTSD